MSELQVFRRKTLQMLDDPPVILLGQLERLPLATRTHTAAGFATTQQGTQDSERWNEPTPLNEMRIKDKVSDRATTRTLRAVKLSEEVFDFLHARWSGLTDQA